MGKQKYDWSALKLDFFQSDIDEIKGFFSAKGVKYNSKIGTNTKGWAKEKQEYKEKIVEEALKKNAEKQIEELEIPIELLKKGKKNYLIGIINDSSKKSDKMSMSDKVKGLNAIKTELLEPTSVGKTDTTLRGEPLDENLFIQD